MYRHLHSKFYLLCLVLLVTSTLGGCASQTGGDTAAQQTAPASTAEADNSNEKEQVIKPFTMDTLYALLVAEIAGNRNQHELALHQYLQQAHITRDLGITRRAVLIAQYLGALQLQEAYQTVELWTELEPDNPEPVYILATENIKRGNLDLAYDYSLQLQAMGSATVFQSIAAQATRFSEAEQDALLQRLDTDLETWPEHFQLLMGKSLLLHYRGEHETALKYVNRAIAVDKEELAAWQLKANLLDTLDKPEKAAKIIATQLQKHPDNRRLQLQYARILTRFDLAEAQQQFHAMVKQSPFDADLLLSLALVSKELGDTATATEYFEQLLFLNKHASAAYYYLGNIAEEAGEIDRAMEHYRRVSGGEEYLFAIASLCELALEQDNYPPCQTHLSNERKRFPIAAQQIYLIEADLLQRFHKNVEGLELLNKALEDFPDDTNLLYTRSLTLEQLNQLDEAEADLRRILQLKPDDANALNALGYVLANKTDRYEEAYEYISRALEIEPDNPAYIDSMGWVLYRMNQQHEALLRLRRAMDLYPNHEIAAHLGEVLWVMGEKEEARKVWEEGLKDAPDSQIIRDTKERLNAY